PAGRTRLRPCCPLVGPPLVVAPVTSVLVPCLPRRGAQPASPRGGGMVCPGRAAGGLSVEPCWLVWRCVSAVRPGWLVTCERPIPSGDGPRTRASYHGERKYRNTSVTACYVSLSAP